jgi:putative DNA primase/helicase
MDQTYNLIALQALQSKKAASPEEVENIFAGLEKKPSWEQVRSALSKFREALLGMDDISRELARDVAVKRLRELGVTSPGRLVDRTMPPSKTGGAQRSGLPEPDLWPEQVEGAELLASLEQTVGRFLALAPGQIVPLVLWVVFAHAHDAFEISPILAITSPDKGCGKSTALALLSALVPRPLTSANITPSAVFRATERFKPCLLLDEADTFLSESEGLRGVLNSGHMRSQAYVTRVTGDDHYVSMFSTWAPKAIAMI